MLQSKLDQLPTFTTYKCQLELCTIDHLSDYNNGANEIYRVSLLANHRVRMKLTKCISSRCQVNNAVACKANYKIRTCMITKKSDVSQRNGHMMDYDE